MAAPSFVMLALGDYRFGMETAAYQTLERTSAWRWEKIDRLGERPAMQFLGPGEDTIALDGTIYPHFRGGLGQLDDMRATANQGKPLLLVDGAGIVWGRYCITEVRESQAVFFSNGQPRRVDFAMTLTMYGGDGV